MHLKLCGKEACDSCKYGTQKDTHNQCEDHPHYDRQPCEVKNMSEYAAGIDPLVHDDGSSGHTHTHHTSDRQVRTCQKDQSRNSQSQEHSGRSLLENVQHIIIS